MGPDRQVRFDLTQGFPLLTTKKLHTRSIIHELLWFISGSTHTAPLQAKGVKIWDGNGCLEQANGSLVSGDNRLLAGACFASGVTVVTARGSRYVMRRRKNGIYGLTRFSAELVDGADPVTVTYPSTENWTYRAKKNVGVRLNQGGFGRRGERRRMPLPRLRGLGTEVGLDGRLPCPMR